MKDCCKNFGAIEELHGDNPALPTERNAHTKTRHLENQKGAATMLASELWLSAKDDGELADLQSVVGEKRLTASIRFGDRTAETSDPKGGYQVGKFIRLKLQKADGAFGPLEVEVIVKAVEKKSLEDLSDRDLLGTLFSGKSKADLTKRLENAYRRKLAPEDLVTIVRFEYLDDLKSAADLVRTHVLAYAREPKDNPGHLDFSTYTAPLTEHDYPAKTPVMWNGVYRALGSETRNVMLVGDPKQARQILDVLRRDPKYLGGGAAVGFKDEVAAHLDELDMLAKAIGAVNFILKTEEGKLKGFNTDGFGFAESLEAAFAQRGEKLPGKKILILGAGGAGNAIAFTLALRGAAVVILNRNKEKALDLAERINRYFKKQLAYGGGRNEIPEKIFTADALVAAIDDPSSPLEHYVAFGEIILPPTAENIKTNLASAQPMLVRLDRRVIISDIMLRQELTATLREARRAGFEILDGIPMVINQGREAFWLLHGSELGAKGITKDELANIMRGAAST